MSDDREVWLTLGDAKFVVYFDVAKVVIVTEEGATEVVRLRFQNHVTKDIYEFLISVELAYALGWATIGVAAEYIESFGEMESDDDESEE